VDVYRTPDERFEGLPGFAFEPRYLEQDGLRMHYVEEGAGDPILLLHGEPTWSFLYRKLVPPLAAVGRVLAPDYFGFGRSDKPVPREWYSFDTHYRSLERFALELDLRRATLVVQDWGGPLGLRLAVEHPDRVERLAIMNTGVTADMAGSQTWLRFRALVRRAGTDFEASRLVRVSCATELGDDVLAAYDAPYPVPEAKTGMLMFPELVPIEKGRASAAAWLALREGVGRWEKPALVLFSDSDPIFSTDDAVRLAAHIPGALPAETVTGAGHFLQEDKGEEIGDRIARFVEAAR
jgi:haloalkane dehalogenase